MSENDKPKPTVAGVVCEDGLCKVVKPAFLGAATGATSTAVTSGSSAPARRPFLVDLLHGNVDLERFFKDE